MRRIIRKSDLDGTMSKSLDSKNLSASPDNYLDKMAKLVPAEIVAGFLAADNLILTQIKSVGEPTGQIKIVYWALFLILLLVTPIYVKRAMGSELKPLKSQILVSSLAFVFWVFAIGGPFALENWYENWLAGLALIVFSVVSPLLIPKE